MGNPEIFFEITDTCNHICWYCCKGFRAHPGLTMSYATLDKVLALPKSRLVISGGEPSLCRDEVFYMVKQSDVPVAVNTNLTCWTREDLQSLSQSVRLQISVPSMFKDEYESITGSLNYARLLENLDYVGGGNTIIAIAVHSRNRDRLAQSLSRLAVRGFRSFMLQPVYGAAAREDDFEASVRAIENVYNTNRHLNIFFLAHCGSSMPATHQCSAGRGRLVILSNGDIVPCACRKMNVLGNLFAADFNFSAVREAGDAFYQSFPPEQRTLCKGYL